MNKQWFFLAILLVLSLTLVAGTPTPVTPETPATTHACPEVLVDTGWVADHLDDSGPFGKPLCCKGDACSMGQNAVPVKGLSRHKPLYAAAVKNISLCFDLVRHLKVHIRPGEHCAGGDSKIAAPVTAYRVDEIPVIGFWNGVNAPFQCVGCTGSKTQLAVRYAHNPRLDKTSCVHTEDIILCNNFYIFIFQSSNLFI